MVRETVHPSLRGVRSRTSRVGGPNPTHRRWPTRMNLKDVLFRASTGVHRALFSDSKEQIFGRVLGMPVAKLDMIGRKSGKVRSSILTVPIVDGERLVLVASSGGDD